MHTGKLQRLDLRGVVGVELNLVDGGCDLGTRVGEQLLEVLDSEVGNTNVLHAARLGQLLHLSPGVLEVPVGVVLLEVVGVGRRRPMLWFCKCLVLLDAAP